MSDSRSRILHAASELFLEGGVAALSVRAISKRAGLSTIGIYSHFNGKQGILDSLYIEGFEKVYAAMDVVDLDLSRREKVLLAASNYLDVAQHYGAHYRLIFGESDSTYTPSEEATQASNRAFKRLVDNTSLFLPGDATASKKQQTAIEVWAIVHGYVSLSNHAVSGAMGDIDWKAQALSAIETHIDAMELRAASS